MEHLPRLQESCPAETGRGEKQGGTVCFGGICLGWHSGLYAELPFMALPSRDQKLPHMYFLLVPIAAVWTNSGMLSVAFPGASEYFWGMRTALPGHVRSDRLVKRISQ